jgi:DNA polymerase I-like protein with 3'-5' exonuclease and polymerase domains
MHSESMPGQGAIPVTEALIRIPSVYSLHRIATGRIASGAAGVEKEGSTVSDKVQQFHNFPKKIRDIYVARPGYALVGADWAGVEWAITVWDAAQLNVPRGFHAKLLKSFRAGEFDPHTHLASIAYGVPVSEVLPWQRTNAKPFTHGRSYLGAHTTLGREQHIPDKTSKLVCDVHEQAFLFHIWQQWTYEMAKKNKYVETPLGWRRYFWAYQPKITEILGTRIQATAADLLKWVLVEMFKHWPQEDWVMWTTTHDSMVVECPEPDLIECAHWVQERMEQPIPWLGGESFRADVKMGWTWKEVS